MTRIDLSLTTDKLTCIVHYFFVRVSSLVIESQWQTELTFIEEGAEHDTKGDEGHVVDDEEDQDEGGVGGVEDTPILPHSHKQAQKVEDRSQEQEYHGFHEDGAPVDGFTHPHQLHGFLELYQTVR